MSSSFKRWSKVAWVILAVILCWYVGHQPALVVHGTVLDKPGTTPVFNLKGIDGREFNNQSLRGHWTMLFFGFTHCSSVCPARLMNLAKMVRILKRQRTAVLPHVVMLSLDPERDALAQLKNYVRTFNPNFYAATGPGVALQGLQHTWGIGSETVVRHTANGKVINDIEHSSTVMVFNPQGELVAFLTSPATAEQLASDFLIISKQRNT